MAKGGLDYMYDNFEFIREGKKYVLREALAVFKGSFNTGFVRGTAPKPSKFELEVPYKGQVLKGDDLQRQLDAWVRLGVCELSCGAAISQVANASPWLDLSDRYFVLLGAGAAMGPLQVLLALGANVIAVDLNLPHIWKRLITQAEASCGTLTFPLMAGADAQAKLSTEELYAAAGCNLFTQTPEIKNWLSSVHPGKQLCVGGYAYIPGDLFPRVALAMDVIIRELSEKRQASVAFLCTPTDCHLIPPAAHAASKAHLAKAPLWQQGLNALTPWCAKNARRPLTTAAGEQLYVCDALVTAQGPNYALAKRMQHWRAMLAREAGCIISSNIAPSTRTASVTQNKNFAYAYATMHLFKPYEVPGPETSNAVMTALLIHDLNNPMHNGSPKMPLANPQQIFSSGSFHGGTWRCAFTFDSIGAPAVLIYYLTHMLLKWYLVAYNLAQAAAFGTVLYLSATHLLEARAAGSPLVLWAAPAALAGAPAAAAWRSFGGLLYKATMLMLLEVIHALTGAVRAPVFTTLVQVMSRVTVAAVVMRYEELWSISSLYLIAFAWCVTEVTRYTWYASNLVARPLKPHTWLRYSNFLWLYPLGISGELLILVAALPLLAKTALPAPMAAYNLAHLAYALFALYVPGGYTMYTYMLSQRKKVLGGNKRGLKKE